MHREAVRMLQQDPALQGRALAILKRWGWHPLREQWAQIIAAQDWAAALEETERGDQLRQASPLAVLLPDDVRMRIIREVRRNGVS